MSTNRYAQLAVLLCAATVLLTGCGGGDGVSQSAHSQLQEALDDALAATEAAQTARRQAEEEAEAARTAQQEAEDAAEAARTAQQEAEQEALEAEREAREAEQAAQAAEQARQQAQAEADAQRQAAEAQRQAEADAQAITRAFGLLEAMDPDTRGTDQTGRGDTNIQRQHAASVLGETHPMEVAPRQPKITNLGTSSVRLGVLGDGEFTSAGGIPSLSMGGRSLRSIRLTRDDPNNKTQEMAYYTDFTPRNLRLLDVYDDERPTVDGAKTDEINLADTSSGTAMGVGETAEARTDNAAMYETEDMKLVLQPRLSGVTLPRTGTYTLAADDYTVSYEYTLDDDDNTDGTRTDDDHYDITVVQSFPATLRGVQGRVQFRHTPIEGERTYDSVGDAYSGGCTTRSGTACRPDVPTGATMSFMVTTATGAFIRYGLTGTAWTFRPSSASARIYLDDGQYMYFGWWQETPDEADGVYDLHLIANGMGRWATGNELAEGAAVYTGPAVGKYVRTISAHDELDHAGERRRNAVQGTFTANTRLEATFGAASTVKGTIVNFMDGGTPIPGNWQVNLGEGDMGTTATAITFGGTGDGLDLSGTPTAVIVQGGQAGALPTEDQTGQQTWALMFLGNEDTAALNDLSPAVESQPAAAVGKFDVGLEHVIHFSGAFGVAKN